MEDIPHDARRAGSAKGVLPGVIELDDDFTEKTMADQLAQQRYLPMHSASHFVFTSGNEIDPYRLLAGKEVDGLATTVLRNGARAVVAALWETDDAASSE